MPKTTVTTPHIEKTSTKVFKGWSDLAKVYRALASESPVKTLEIVRHRIANRLQYFLDRKFDARNGTETSFQSLRDLSIASENAGYGVAYIPTSVFSFKRFVRYLPEDLDDFTFVDFGSGKGRAMLIAAGYPFRNVIGVEFSDEMVEIANRNIRSQNPDLRKCERLSSVCMDASEFELPGDNLVLYFFDPFETPVMTRVVERIVESYRSNPRPIYIVYHEPAERAVFDQHDVFHEIKKTRFQFLSDFVYPYPFIVYSMTDSDSRT